MPPTVRCVAQYDGPEHDVKLLMKEGRTIRSGLPNFFGPPCRSSRAGLGRSDSTDFLVFRLFFITFGLSLACFRFREKRDGLFVQDLDLCSPNGHGEGHGLT